MIPVIPTVGVLVFHDDRVLLVRHGAKASHVKDSYGLPAGRVEEGETLIEAAKRELEEETGLVVSTTDLEELPIDLPPADIKRSDGTTKRFSIRVFLCRKYSGELSSSDEATPEWKSLAELDTLALIVNTKLMIEEGQKYR